MIVVAAHTLRTGKRRLVFTATRAQMMVEESTEAHPAQHVAAESYRLAHLNGAVQFPEYLFGRCYGTANGRKRKHVRKHVLTLWAS